MTPIPVEIALTNQSSSVSASEAAEVAGALNQQFADFQRLWRTHYHATVVVRDPAHIEAGSWAIHLQDTIDEQGALGYHSDEHNQPYAIVDVKLSGSGWTTTVSHEFLEMVGDPFGNAMHSGPAPAGWKHAADSPRVKYLREACDPCEAFSYKIGNVDVSDFVTLDWYGHADRGHVGFSFLGKLTSPQEVAEGGYVSWVDPLTSIWWQRFVEGGKAQDESIGRFDRAAFGSLRAFTDHYARQRRT